MTFSEFSKSLQQIDNTTKRLEMTELLAGIFTDLTADEIRPACYLMQGKLVPNFESKEFQLSEKMIIRVLARLSTSANESTQPGLIAGMEEDMAAVTKQYKELGDLGTVAEEQLNKNVIPAPARGWSAFGGKAGIQGSQDSVNTGSRIKSGMTKKGDDQLSLNQVFDELVKIAEENGTGSQERKLAATVELLSKLDALSAKYVVRIILGKLRLGFSDMTMIDALSWMLTGDKSLHNQIEEAYQKRADIGYIAEMIKTKGIEHLDEVKVEVGTPIIPALCQRINTSEEIIAKMGEVIAEPKYDGTRVQIHYQKSPLLVKTYTRNLEESSPMFPELSEAVKDLKCQSCVIDAEAIAFDEKTGKLLPFQQTIQRKRKHGIAETAKSLPLKFFVFDIVEKDGKSLIDEPLSSRKVVLAKLFDGSKTFIQAPYIQTDDPVKLHEYHETQLAAGLEGAVIKKVDGKYQSGRKGYNWVKIKESEGNRGKLSDTIDCIVLGYYKARGARTAFEVGAVLTGVMDDQVIKTISKVGSGFSEALSKEFVERSQDLIIKEKPKEYEVSKLLTPDVWLSPGMVIEVAADEITTSPSHTAGVALRFPRIIRFRDDKSPNQATTLEEVKKMVI